MRQIISLEQVTSTNDYLKQYYKSLDSDTVVVAKSQSKGRGRNGHTWVSPDGNLYFSMLKKNKSRQDLFFEMMNVSVSIIKVLEDYNVKAYIKYPNDIIVSRKKIAGILMESKGFEDLDYLIIGVGLNINQKDFGDLKRKASSLFLETGEDFDVNEILNKFLTYYEDDSDTYKNYVMRSFCIGKQIMHDHKPYVVEGVTTSGELLLRGDQQIQVSLNEISLEELYE
jgi:BirA family biotin operon repressor/biotin-[acetyl-CoA-carboxylase] ligase